MAQVCVMSFPCDFLNLPNILPKFIKITSEYDPVGVFVENEFQC